MDTYIVRVELHPGARQDTAVQYEILHEAMEEQGFSRLIADEDGTLYHLPNAEYMWEGPTGDPDRIHTRAVGAAERTNLRFSILVVEAGAVRFSGLEEVGDPEDDE